MKKILRLIISTLIFVTFNSHGSIINGDFSTNDLTGWDSEGDVMVVNEDVELGDNGEFYSSLYQAVPLAAGSYSLEFDFYNQLSASVPGFSFPDSFFASLYFVDDLNTLDIAAGIFDDVVPVLDLDYLGVFNLLTGATVGPSLKGGDWLHFKGKFVNNFQYVVPAFELLDFNFIDNDSLVSIDNVSISAVPEPATWYLLFFGLFVWQCKKLKTKQLTKFQQE